MYIAGTSTHKFGFGEYYSCLYCGRMLFTSEEVEYHLHRPGYLYCRGFDCPIHAKDCGVRYEEKCSCWVKDVDNYMIEDPLMETYNG